MIISNDYKTLYLSVTKTGTKTANNVLSPYGIRLREHANYIDSIVYAKMNISNFDPANIEKVYLFYRDPVERFISGVNYIRGPQFINFLMKYRQNWFPGVDLTGTISEETQNTCLSMVASITPEQIFADKNLSSTTVILTKQSYWHRYLGSNKIVLDFANFEDNLKTVALEFGAPSDIQIPKLNESVKLTTSLSPELEDAVKAYYAEDYALKPSP